MCLSFLICEPHEAPEEQKEPGVGARGPSSDTSLGHALHRGKTNIVESQNKPTHSLSAGPRQPIFNLERRLCLHLIPQGSSQLAFSISKGLKEVTNEKFSYVDTGVVEELLEELLFYSCGHWAELT